MGVPLSQGGKGGKEEWAPHIGRSLWLGEEEEEERHTGEGGKKKEGRERKHIFLRLAEEKKEEKGGRIVPTGGDQRRRRRASLRGSQSGGMGDIKSRFPSLLALPPFPAPLCRGKCEVINRRFFSPSFSPSDPLYTFVVSRLVFRPEISRPHKMMVPPTRMTFFPSAVAAFLGGLFLSLFSPNL